MATLSAGEFFYFKYSSSWAWSFKEVYPWMARYNKGSQREITIQRIVKFSCVIKTTNYLSGMFNRYIIFTLFITQFVLFNIWVWDAILDHYIASLYKTACGMWCLRKSLVIWNIPGLLNMYECWTVIVENNMDLMFVDNTTACVSVWRDIQLVQDCLVASRCDKFHLSRQLLDKLL